MAGQRPRARSRDRASRAARAATHAKTGPIRIEEVDIDPSAEASPATTAETASIVKRVAHGQLPLREALEELKRDAIASTLDETKGNWAEAARRLGMDRGNLHHMAQRLRISGR